MTPPQLPTADRYYAQSAAIARRASREAAKRGAQTGTLAAAALVIAQYQAAQALQVPANAVAMLAEQGITALASAVLQPLAFVAPPANIEAMLAEVQRDVALGLEAAEADLDAAAEQLWTDWRFERLAESLVQDAARAAQQVDMTTRPRIAHVRHLALPSCSRCAALAGRVYRWSEEFERHPGCDCVMIPTTVVNDEMAYDIDELVRSGQVGGLSRADRKALADGADFNKVVNAKRGRGGARDASGYLSRSGRPTPAGIYKLAAGDQAKALELLQAAGYIRP